MKVTFNSLTGISFFTTLVSRLNCLAYLTFQFPYWDFFLYNGWKHERSEPLKNNFQFPYWDFFLYNGECVGYGSTSIILFQFPYWDFFLYNRGLRRLWRKTFFRLTCFQFPYWDFFLYNNPANTAIYLHLTSDFQFPYWDFFLYNPPMPAGEIRRVRCTGSFNSLTGISFFTTVVQLMWAGI